MSPESLLTNYECEKCVSKVFSHQNKEICVTISQVMLDQQRLTWSGTLQTPLDYRRLESANHISKHHLSYSWTQNK